MDDRIYDFSVYYAHVLHDNLIKCEGTLDENLRWLCSPFTEFFNLAENSILFIKMCNWSDDGEETGAQWNENKARLSAFNRALFRESRALRSMWSLIWYVLLNIYLFAMQAANVGFLILKCEKNNHKKKKKQMILLPEETIIVVI